ncbi:phenylacetate--CoA ligase family protein [[Eubacterium] cellulosolvens]
MLLRTLSDWVWLEHCERLKSEQLFRIQKKKFRETVKYAFDNVPFYHNLYKLTRVDPDTSDRNSLDKLPIITKQQVREVPLKERTAKDTDINSCLLRTTSGTTGIPVTVLDEPNTTARRAALWLRRFWAYGIRPIDRVCMVVPGEHRSGVFKDTKGLAGYLMQSRIKTFSLAKKMREHLQLISKWRPTVLIGPASFHRSLIAALEAEEYSFGPKVVISNGEMLDGKTRKLISDTYNTENVFETYGAAEAGPMAWECPTHSGYHINAESIIVESLKDGEIVNPGEVGELCVTNLYRRVTPFIRYLIGDAIILSEDDCSCGRGLPVLKEKHGRLVDFILTKDGTQLSPFRVMHVLEDVPGIAQYKVIQESNHSIVVLIQPLQSRNLSFRETLQDRCDALFRGMRVEIRIVDKIEAQNAKKYRIVESRLKYQ